MKQCLNLNGQWTLYTAPNAWVKQNHFSAVAEKELQSSHLASVSAEVPGNFELDLHRANRFPDPYYGTNPLLCQKEENKHLWYAKTFSLSELPEGELFFRFEGIDTFAEIFLNGVLIGTCDNMLIEHEYPANGLRVGENELLVHILPTAIVARNSEGNILNKGQPYNDDSLHVRKAPYMFGWDIMPRMVSGGIWRSVSLIAKPYNRIDEFYITTEQVNTAKNTATLWLFTRLSVQEDFLDGFRMVITGRCQNSEFEKTLKFWSANKTVSFSLSDPMLWWPRNEGNQNLYDIEVKLYLGDAIADTYTTRLGIRSAKLERTSVINENNEGKFEFLINGKKIFVMGTNWVPLDAFPSQNEKRLPRALDMVEDIGCNMIRLWGGNIYECDDFYNWCDEHGIMLWQDFIMGCGYYPQYASFREALRKEAVTAVKRLRSHASLILWAGDNECDVFCRSVLNPNDNVLTRKVLPEVLKTYDPFRPYLPSSPYVDDMAYRSHRPLSEEHIWGPRNFFKSNYYLNTVCRFASETGFHGCPSPDSMKQYIGESHLWPNMRENGRPDEEWLAHASSMEVEDVGPYEYRISLMNRQVTELFGTLSPEETHALQTANNAQEKAKIYRRQMLNMFGDSPQGLNDFAKASQIFQAEAFKFIIERFRIRKETHGGLIWWNLLDGWPQISDAVVDYYFCKKLAYTYIANAQQPLCLMFDEPEDGNIWLYAANEFPVPHRLTYSVKRVSDDATVCFGQTAIEANGITKIGKLSLSEHEQDWYWMEWEDENGNRGHNHYVTNIRGFSYQTYCHYLQKTNLAHFEGFSQEEES